MSNEIIRSSEAIIEWWLAFSYVRKKGKIFPKKFSVDDTERKTVGDFLQNWSLQINDDNYKELREAVYNQGVISGCKILDENDGHDPLTYFSISYICSIFWLL